MTTAILSIIPFTSPCCFLIGTPIGIWALWVLTDPDVKAAFR
jgi:ABC-type proline/glycine betaine transport system permease subunit